MWPHDEVLSSLDETLRLLQRTVGYSDGTAMAMDPDVVLPTQFLTTLPADRAIALRACRNEQRDRTSSSSPTSTQPLRTRRRSVPITTPSARPALLPVRGRQPPLASFAVFALSRLGLIRRDGNGDCDCQPAVWPGCCFASASVGEGD